jgi:biopolymer transport protein ExbB
MGASAIPGRALGQADAPPAGEAVPVESSGDATAPAGAPPETTEPSKVASIPTNPAEVAMALGIFYVVPFVIASLIAMWIAIERLVILRRGRVIPKPFVARFLDHLEQGKLNRQSALKLCEENGSAVAEVFAHGVRKWGKPSVEVEQAIIDGGERQVSKLRSHLRILNGVATISPLLGLLGTVTGMIQTFNEIARSDAMGKPEQLAVGIAIALLTTAVGLMIAIPVLVVHMFLSGRVDSLVMEMDHLSQDVVNLISAEGLASRPIASETGPARRASAAESREKKAV